MRNGPVIWLRDAARGGSSNIRGFLSVEAGIIGQIDQIAASNSPLPISLERQRGCLKKKNTHKKPGVLVQAEWANASFFLGRVIEAAVNLDLVLLVRLARTNPSYLHLTSQNLIVVGKELGVTLTVARIWRAPFWDVTRASMRWGLSRRD